MTLTEEILAEFDETMAGSIATDNPYTKNKVREFVLTTIKKVLDRAEEETTPESLAGENKWNLAVSESHRLWRKFRDEV